MAITGAHVILYTSERRRRSGRVRDVFGFDHRRRRWLARLRLPPAEVAVHLDRRARAPHEQLPFLEATTWRRTIAELRAKGLDVDTTGDPTGAVGEPPRPTCPLVSMLFVQQPR